MRVVVVGEVPDVDNVIAGSLPNVSTYASLDNANLAITDLCIWSLTNELLSKVPLLPCPTIVLLPGADLTSIVALMQRSNQIIGVTRGVPEAIALARRMLGADHGGIEHVVGKGVVIASERVSDFADKIRVLALIASAAEASGISRPEAIEQSVDEMVMNALYDAPVDANGLHIFANMPPRARSRMRTSQVVTVQYAFDGERFVVRVRDAFGSISRETILKFLHKSLHASDVVDRRAGGAGLGLYLVTSAASVVLFEIVPGTLTSITCIFDVARREISELGVVTYNAGDHRRTPPARRRLAIHYLVRRVALLASLAVLSVGLALRHRARTAPALLSITATRGATLRLDGKVVGTSAASIADLYADRTVRISAQLDGYQPRRTLLRLAHGANLVELVLEPVTSLTVETNPTGASVTVAGKSMGTSPLKLALPLGTKPTLVIELDGYRELSVPASENVVLKLQRDDNLVRVHVTSIPPGAAVVRGMADPGADRTYTPTDLYVPRNEPQTITLVMAKYAPLVLQTFTPTTGAALDKQGRLVALP